ncbi:Hydrolase [Dirofilaria immitis]|nr:Hydrolase [Dirofilaria immitis]
MNRIKLLDDQNLLIKLDEIPTVLRTQHIRIDFFDRQSIDVKAIVQDSRPSGSCIGTVVGCHGTPGSHNDFKYIVPYLHAYGIRFIGINFPGQGYTQHYEGLRYTNEERMQFVQKIINSMDIGDKIVFLGHSRGSENVLRLAARNPDRCKGVALINPLGIRIHRSIKSKLWAIKFALWLWETFRIFRSILRFIFYAIFKLSEIKVGNGDEAAVCLKLVDNLNLTGQLEYINILNNNQTKVLIAYSDMDRVIEVSNYSSTRENISILDYISKQYAKSDRSFSICFENEDHYLQKHHAKFIANCIYSMLIAENTTNGNAENGFKSFLHL